MRKSLFLFIAIILFLFGNNSAVSASEKPPSVSADSVVLMDAATGTILYSKNPNSAYPPASTTKIMTALLTLENAKLTDLVTVGENPPKMEPSKIYIKEGEVLTVKDLLYGLLLQSGNDAAVALAEHIGGSVSGFADMMNKRAKELGCTNTNFVNPHGLYDKNHKTSAKDLALIMKEIVKHPEFGEISTTGLYKIPQTNKDKKVKEVYNHNKLVLKGAKEYYEECIGGKTGWTSQSLFSYVSAAERNGQVLIAALVHDANRAYYSDSPKLYSYGFDNFKLKKLFSKGDEISTYAIEENVNVPLMASEDFYYVIKKGSNEEPKVSVAQCDVKDRSVAKGEPLTTADISLNNQPLDTVELVSGIDYEYKSVESVLEKVTSQDTENKGSNKQKFILIVSIIAFLFILLLIARARARRKRMRRRLKYLQYTRKNRNI
jgi:serine-type D-Ala-D-Ala carboxypeptidase (penicillin-binding protein 5/6)